MSQIVFAERTYTAEELSAMSDGELAARYYSHLDGDPEGKEPTFALFRAEIDRRGLTDDQVDDAWHLLTSKALVAPVLREATEDDVEAALAGSYVEDVFANTERAALLEVWNRMLDHLIGPRDE